MPKPIISHQPAVMQHLFTGNVSIELTNILGQNVYAEQIKSISSGTSAHSIKVNSLNLKAGVSFISVVMI